MSTNNHVAAAELVPGWMSRAELTWLAEQAATKKLIVEIGSFVGRSTMALAEATQGIVIAVDDWYGPRNESDVDIDGRAFTKETRKALFERFNTNLEKHIKSGRVVPVKIDYSEMEYSKKLDVKPDMVFIDGDHSYDAVCRDIKIWRSRLEEGGLLCGHDGRYEPIEHALVDSGMKFEIVPDTSIWRVLHGV